MTCEGLSTSTCGPKTLYVAQLGPCVPQLGPSRPIFPGRFWSDFGLLREALEAQKHNKIHGFCYISRSATDIVQIVQISPWEVPKPPPRAPRSGPGRPRRGPRGFKTAPRAAKSAPGAPPEPPKDGFRAALAAKLCPTGTKEPSGGLPETILDPPRAAFAPCGGSIFVQFSFFGKHSQSCPVGKACASLRPAPLWLLV